MHVENEEFEANAELLRQRLNLFFLRHFPSEAEDLVQETLTRLTDLHRREQIYNLHAYALGVARIVRLEHLRKLQAERRLFSECDPLPDPPAPETNYDKTNCMECCIGMLSVRERELIEFYYLGSEGGKAKLRRAMGARLLGIQARVLASRVFRIKAKLAKCYEQCRGKEK